MGHRCRFNAKHPAMLNKKLDLNMSRIAIVGAGITGVTTAYALAQRGHPVTVFERHRYAAMETSFANGGSYRLAMRKSGTTMRQY